jgi:hypothetical protein
MNSSRIRILFVSLLTVFAVGAIASASASAASCDGKEGRPLCKWEVCKEVAGEGKEPPAKFDEHKCNTQKKELKLRKWQWKMLEGAEEFPTTSKGGVFKLEVAGKVITCTAVTDEGNIKAGGKDLATKIVFTGCKAGPNGCMVRSPGSPFGTIEVTNIKTQLEEVPAGSGKLVNKFEQKEFPIGSGKFEFVTLEFEGATCAGEGFVKTKVKGDVAAECKNLANGNVELNFPKPAIAQPLKLEAFGVAATLTGATEEELTNKWAHRCI